VRVLPTSPGPNGSNAILCAMCFQHEMNWRRERNKKLSADAQFPIVQWRDLPVY
jgi:hypothetical protein